MSSSHWLMRCFVFLALLIAMPTVLYAQAGVDVDGWHRVEQLAVGTHVKISASHGGGECVVASVSTESVVCQHGSGSRAVLRGDVKAIRISRRGRSAAAGLAVGGGIGVGIGVASGLAYNSSDRNSLLHTTAGNSAGVGAAVGFVVGGAAGCLISVGKDLFAGPVVYRR